MIVNDSKSWFYYHRSISKKYFDVDYYVLWLKKVRWILKFRSLKLVIKSKLLRTKIFLAKVSLKNKNIFSKGFIGNCSNEILVINLNHRSKRRKKIRKLLLKRIVAEQIMFGLTTQTFIVLLCFSKFLSFIINTPTM